MGLSEVRRKKQGKIISEDFTLEKSARKTWVTEEMQKKMKERRK